MHIGIDASRAFLQNRTGIEEYAYRVIEYLRKEIPEETKVALYVKKGAREKAQSAEENVKCQMSNVKCFPKNWEIREISWNRFWTQGGLAWEMFRRPVDVLLVPAHTVPWVHPEKTVVVVHGLEYEFCPEAYAFFDRWYMRISIWLSCRWAWRVIAVSENTKRDLMRLYGVAEEKIRVIYEGYEVQKNFQFPISNFQSISNDTIPQCLNGEENAGISDLKIQSSKIDLKFKIQNSKFLLFIGRIEERKNIVRIIEAFAMLKEKYHIPHKLVLAGKPGYGYRNIKYFLPPLRLEDSTPLPLQQGLPPLRLEDSTPLPLQQGLPPLRLEDSTPPLGQGRGSNVKCRDEIIELGYVSEEEKWELLSRADVLVFPSLYEGFGLPILEAQAAGVPVVTSNVSSLPEIVSFNFSKLLGKPPRLEGSTPLQRKTTPPRGLGTPPQRGIDPDYSPPAEGWHRGDGVVSSFENSDKVVSAVLVDPYDAGAIAEGIWSILSDNKKREQLVSLGHENVKRFSWEKCAREIAKVLIGEKV